MFDHRARALCSPALDVLAGRLVRLGVRANLVTGSGWLVGVGACVAVSFRMWALALAGWLLNRLLDGLDGAIARRRGATDFGAYLDVMADFSVYAGFVVALAIARPEARLASVVLLSAYYVSGVALLGAAALLDRRNVVRRDERGVRFMGGLAEGLETVLAYVVILIAPTLTVEVEWIFAAMVLVTAIQRLNYVHRALLDTPALNVRPWRSRTTTS
jgi:phosphatidylglycerophosphate synthase